MIVRNGIVYETFRCANPHCRRSFPQTILVQNLSSERPVQYYGCPYCLTLLEENSSIESKATTGPDDKYGIRHLSRMKCLHNYGYLSGRSKESSVPKECLMCQRVTDCMLFKLK